MVHSKNLNDYFSFVQLSYFMLSASNFNHHQHNVGTQKSQWQKMPYKNNFDLAATAKSLQLCLTLCDSIDGSPPGASVPGILQARTLEWVAISFSNAWKWKVKVKSFSRVQLLVTQMDCSPPGSTVHGIFRARVLEWVAIAFSKFWPWCFLKVF